MNNEWPKTVIIGLSRAGDELEQRLPYNQVSDQQDWSFVRTAYYLYEDGSRGVIDQRMIDSFNATLREAIAAAESPNARFDRLKAEAHERRASENRYVVIPGHLLGEPASYMAERALDAAMTKPLPLDIPLFAGPRHGTDHG